jgi:hypothetical protein
MRSDDPKPNVSQETADPGEVSPVVSEELEDNGDLDIREAIDKAEYFYARGVQYFRSGIPDSAQEVYEQALLVLSDLDVDPDEKPEQAARIETLLNEIEQDYRLTGCFIPSLRLWPSGNCSTILKISKSLRSRTLFGNLINPIR